jgi:hypothetical protein
MASSDLLGPHRLDFESVEAKVPRIKPGAYALGYLDHRNNFFLNKIGRFDADLRSGLKELIGTSAYFKFVTTDTSRTAFESECRLYHEYSLESGFHPVRSANKDWTCPYCRTVESIVRTIG